MARQPEVGRVPPAIVVVPPLTTAKAARHLVITPTPAAEVQVGVLHGGAGEVEAAVNPALQCRGRVSEAV